MLRRKKKDMYVIEHISNEQLDAADVSENGNVLEVETQKKSDVNEVFVSTLVTDKPKPKRRRIFAVPFGVLMFVLSVIGLVTSITFCVGTVKDLIKHEQEMLEYEEMLKPVVMFDPTAFDDLSKADAQFLLQTAIWKTVTVNTYPEQFSTDVSGRQIVPVELVEASYRELFGTEVTPTHKSFTGYGLELEYSDTLSSYLVPSTGISPIYYPDVVEYNKRGESIILRVGYIASADLVEVEEGVYKTPEPAKYMNVTLRNKDGAMYISALQATE